MLTKVIKRGFGSFNIINSINNFKKAITAPIKHLKVFSEPTGLNNSTQTNTTAEAFDQVSHQWQTLIGGNPFDLQTYNFLENAQLTNFGTVDNPLVIFTADAPFRYVCCTGPQNEDDYESHEPMWMMLREGPLQRCGVCGQVFKLVRLRDERSSAMDYYLPNFNQYEGQQMGEHDIITLLSIQKMTTHYEYTHFETPEDSTYSLINPDEHDRVLVDPAFRMQKLTFLQQRARFLNHILDQIHEEDAKNSKFRQPISKLDYENLIQVETAIKKLDRNFRKVLKFESRKYVDPDNHDRRQRRMQQRAKKRWEGAYTLFTGTLSEEEQKYRDYFETDLQNYREDERIEEFLDREQLLNEPRYNLTKFDFQESYVNGSEDDQTSYIEKKIFKYKYRQALDSKQNYERRSARVVQRQKQRFEKNNVQQIIDNYLRNPLQNQQAYLNLVRSESAYIYKDYFQSEQDQNIDILAKVSPVSFVQIFENFQIPKRDRSSFVTIKQTPWNPALGWWANTIAQWSDVQNIIPVAQQFTNQSLLRERGQISGEVQQTFSSTQKILQEQSDFEQGELDKFVDKYQIGKKKIEKK